MRNKKIYIISGSILAVIAVVVATVIFFSCDSHSSDTGAEAEKQVAAGENPAEETSPSDTGDITSESETETKWQDTSQDVPAEEDTAEPPEASGAVPEIPAGLSDTETKTAAPVTVSTSDGEDIKNIIGSVAF